MSQKVRRLKWRGEGEDPPTASAGGQDGVRRVRGARDHPWNVLRVVEGVLRERGASPLGQRSCPGGMEKRGEADLGKRIVREVSGDSDNGSNISR